ncbi:MAG: aldehyde dehydrogenase family protein [Ilumatobacteraceae bacterium]
MTSARARRAVRRHALTIEQRPGVAGVDSCPDLRRAPFCYTYADGDVRELHQRQQGRCGQRRDDAGREPFARASSTRRRRSPRSATSARRCRRPPTRFPGWADATPSQRSRALLRIAGAIESRAEEFIAAEVENTGKPTELMRSEEIPPAVDQIRFFAGAARLLEGKAAGEYMENMTSFVRREPVGVCAQVTPWNYPLMMAVWKFAPALAAGNTVVLKPSDTTPASTTLLAEVASEFLPPGVLNVIAGDRDTGRLMVEHDVPAMISITGVGARRDGGRQRRGHVAEARSPRARRQGAGRRVRRRRPRRGCRGHRRGRLFQRRAGLHGGDAGHRLAGRVRRPRRTRSPSRRRGRRRACPTRTCCTGRSTTPTSSTG